MRSRCDGPLSVRVKSFVWPAAPQTCMVAVALFCWAGSAHGQAWQPKTAPLMTRWAADVSPDRVHPEYPRPQLVRPDWLNLNGLWDYAITPRDAGRPRSWTGQILVPFPVESALSGVMQTVGPEQALWYRRDVDVPTTAAWTGKRLWLRFEACDWETTVWVNGHQLGQHRGGYDPFAFDITDHVPADQGRRCEVVVRVVDPTDRGDQPRGKQVAKPEGIWYTPVTGIWQTVWLEPVPENAIRQAFVTADIDRDTAQLTLQIDGAAGATVAWEGSLERDGIKYGTTFRLPAKSGSVELDSSPQFRKELWTPDRPLLTHVKLTLQDKDGKPLDEVQTYFARRKISVGPDAKGVLRMLLNNQPLFQYGTLDQGWWPDGLYTAPTDEALKFDIEITKQYGFNMIRKHVKVEPARWYYWCDLLGMLVWQDMPSGSTNAPWDPFGGHDGTELTRTADAAGIYRKEWQAIIDSRRQFPSIVMWVPFNEAWGQFDTVAVTEWTKQYDPSRLVNCASGGNDFAVGDVIDIHRYPGPAAPKPSQTRVAVLGEYGGLGLPLPGHTWQSKKNWGYRSFTNQADLTEAYLDLLDRLRPLIEEGLSAAIYTQTTDVEIEVNGLLTYDRAVKKIPVSIAAEAHRALWAPWSPKQAVPLLETAETAPAEWRYTTTAPPPGWEQPDFDADEWTMAMSGFGEPSTPGAKVQTAWKSPDIWLRRTFEITEPPRGEVRLRIHHDEDAEVYLDGVLLKKVSGYTTGYVSLRLPDVTVQALRPGKHLLAVHCHQTGGGQYIDVGLELQQTVIADPATE
jgi:hypothetical protein